MKTPMTAPPGDLHARIIARENLRRAWAVIERRGASPGIDRVTSEQWRERAEERIELLHTSLKTGRYKPSPGMRITLASDPERKIAVPTITDRVVQRAIVEQLTPHFERIFSGSSHAYRRGRSVRTAAHKVEGWIALGYRHIARTDIRAFFDTIEREVLLEGLAAHGLGEDVCGLIDRLLRAGAILNASLEEDDGLMQGSSLSPLLSNVYLHEVDACMDEAGFPYLRYADDILLMGPSSAQVEDGLTKLTEALAPLSLSLNLRKTFRCELARGFDYLGVRFNNDGASTSRAAHRALNKRANALAARGRFEPVVSFIKDWERWYGSISLLDVDSIGMIAGCLSRALDGGGGHSVRELARRRIELFGYEPLSPLAHASLVEAWLLAMPPRQGESISDHNPMKAAIIDTVLALTSSESENSEDKQAAARRRVEDAMALPEDALLQVSDIESLIGELARRGCTGLADAASALMQRPPSSDRRPKLGLHEAPVDTLERWIKLFRGRPDIHCVERKDQRGHYRFLPERKPLAASGLREHLSGGQRRGIYLVDLDGCTEVMALHVFIHRDIVKERWGLGPNIERNLTWHQWQERVRLHTAALARSARQMGLSPIEEDDGMHGRRLWLLLDGPVPLRHARRVVQDIIGASGDVPDGLVQHHFPSISYLRKGPGPYLPMPMGIDPRTEGQSAMLDQRGEPFARLADVCDHVTTHSPSKVYEVARKGPLHERHVATTGEDVLSALTSYPTAKETLNRCDILRTLAHKAFKIGHLESEERASLFEALGYLHEQEVVAALSTILEPCGRGDRAQVSRRIAKLGEYPISCRKLAERHAGILHTRRCEGCKFRGLRHGAYPTPVLNAMAVEKIPIFARKLEQARGKRKHHKKKQRPGEQAAHREHRPESPEQATSSEMTTKSTPRDHEEVAVMEKDAPMSRAGDGEQTHREVPPQHDPPDSDNDIRDLLARLAAIRAESAKLDGQARALLIEITRWFDGHGGERVFVEGVGWLERDPEVPDRFLIVL